MKIEMGKMDYYYIEFKSIKKKFTVLLSAAFYEKFLGFGIDFEYPAITVGLGFGAFQIGIRKLKYNGNHRKRTRLHTIPYSFRRHANYWRHKLMTRGSEVKCIIILGDKKCQ